VTTSGRVELRAGPARTGQRDDARQELSARPRAGSQERALVQLGRPGRVVHQRSAVAPQLSLRDDDAE
jgi:hypothetical protein